MDTIKITKKLIAFGSKKIYFPKFTVALVRTPNTSPYHARFLVPLDFSKYDLRDYLFHAYNVRCFNIRSYVKQMPVRDTRELPRHWFRPESKKYMTIEMEKPFVWPEVPDLEPWGQKEAQQEKKNAKQSNRASNTTEARDTARYLREQAKKLLHKEAALQDESIKRKKAQRVPLTAEEQETEDKRKKRNKEISAMSTFELWKDKRTEKVVESNDPERYKIKA